MQKNPRKQIYCESNLKLDKCVWIDTSHQIIMKTLNGLLFTVVALSGVVTFGDGVVTVGAGVVTFGAGST